MDLLYLKKSARQFAYQLRKFFPSDESPINHYICEKHVVVLSTKKLYIYYFDTYIDYVGEYLNQCVVEKQSQKERLFSIKINEKKFTLVFEQEKDYNSFLKYFEKYKD